MSTALLEPGWTSAVRPVNGLSLHVVEAGPVGGPLLILPHGFPEFWWGWRHQITPLAERGFRVVVPDLRGYNQSDAPQEVSAYRLDTLTADVVGLADDYGARRFRLVGHDWGGIVAREVATRHPERTERLVVMNAPHPDSWARQALAHPTQAFRSRYVALFQLPRLPEAALGAFGHAGLRAMVARTARPDAFRPGELGRYAEAGARPGSLTAMLNYYRALRQRKAGEPRRTPVRTLVLWGEQDRFLERHQAEAALARCDDARLVGFGNATHWLHLEEPGRVNRELVGFLT